MELLFVYGTLMDPRVQERIISIIIKGEEDILQGYEKSSIEIEGFGYPILVSNKNSKVEGIVLKINVDELKKIDAYETKAYRRIKVKLKSGKEVWAYVK